MSNQQSSQWPNQQPNQEHFPVVIVGAGMVGAALACGLDDVGISCLVLETQQLNTATDWPENDVDPRVSAISLASQNVLTNVGAWARISAMKRLQAYQRMYVWDAMGTANIEFTAAEQHLPELGHILENRTITAALHQELLARGVSVWTGVKLQDVSQQTLQPRTLYLADGRNVTTDLVVGADGATSKIRHLSGLPTREWDYPHHALVTRVALSRPHRDTAWQRFTDNGVLAFLPLRSPQASQAASHCSIVWSQPKEAADANAHLSTQKFCQTLEKAFEGQLGQVLDRDECCVFPLRQRHAKQYMQSGLVLVGDAAHTIHPLAGQGVNLGFLDVAALVQVLNNAHEQDQALGDLSVLQAYQHLRRGDNLRMTALMESFVRLFGNQQPMLSMLRNYGLQTMQQLPSIKQHFARQALGVGAHLPPLAQPWP